MSSPASRKRQRHRRRADQKVWTAQSALAAREADLAAYDRVIADIDRQYRDTTFGALELALVTVRREAVRLDYDRLQQEIRDLQTARKALEPLASDPRETISP